MFYYAIPKNATTVGAKLKTHTRNSTEKCIFLVWCPFFVVRHPLCPFQQQGWSSTPLLETFLHTPSGKVVFFSSSSNTFPSCTSCLLHGLKQGAPQVEEETANTRPGGNWRGVVTARNLQKTKLVENMMGNNKGNQESHIFSQCTCE